MGAQHRFRVFAALSVIMTFSLSAHGVTLQASQVAGALGATGVSLPISFLGAPGKSVSAIQFDLVLDAKQFELTGITLGPSAIAAEKAVSFSHVGPGRYRIIVAGFNQTPLPSGVLIIPDIRILPNAAGGTFAANLANRIFSDPQGQPVAGKGIHGAITVFRRWHSADISKDYTVSVSELLRVIQLFSFKRYHCAPGSEDGFGLGAGPTDCAPHSSDFNPADWTITISELLRLIQFYNASGYQLGLGTEDGFAPGRAP